MLQIFLASLSVGIGSFFLRKGDIFGLLLQIINKNYLSDKTLIFTIIGILLNLLGIYFWQSSVKSQIQFSVAFSLYLSLTLIFGIIFGSLYEKTKLSPNLLIGCSLITFGIILISNKS